MTTANLIPDLQRDEGLRLSAYQDTLGFWTIGYGHRPSAPGVVWTQAQSVAVLFADVQHKENVLDVILPWWRGLDDVRQDVIAEMAFNMGVSALSQFHNTLKAVQSEDWQKAHDGMLASLWARQVGERAVRLANQMLTGEHQ